MKWCPKITFLKQLALLCWHFSHSSILELGRGDAIKQLLLGVGITRLLKVPELDKVYRS